MKVVNALIGFSIALMSLSSWALEEDHSTELVKAALLQVSANTAIRQ